MLVIDEIVIMNKPEMKRLNKIEEFYDPKEICMFDIETTGLSPASAFIYLIGINYKVDDLWHITLLFNDDGKSEALIIREFMDRLSNYKYLMHFNGDTFDIPFVTKRLNSVNSKFNMDIHNSFNDICSIDLLKIIRPYRKSFGLQNVKQKTIEAFLGIKRIDKYNGGELINVYFDYLSSYDEELKQLLIQHNRDDMEGMFFLTSLLAFRDISSQEIEFKDLKCKEMSDKLYMDMTFKFKTMLPASISVKYEGIMLNTFQDLCNLLIPISSLEMKYFFEDYKNYYYYPELDEAFHKSVETSELKDLCREKAKKSNCYTKTNGFFIPAYKFSNQTVRQYKNDCSEKVSYIEISDEFIGNPSLITEYIKSVLPVILNNR